MHQCRRVLFTLLLGQLGKKESLKEHEYRDPKQPSNLTRVNLRHSVIDKAMRFK